MKTLLILHGAIGAADQFSAIEKELGNTYNVRVLNFSGHGGAAYTDKGFNIPAFAEEVAAFLDKEGLSKVSIFGYSMGGYVALYLAKKYPDKVEKVITLATKFHWDETTAEKEIKMLNADKIEEKLPAFAQTLKERHAPNDWKELLAKTAAMLTEMGKDNPLKLEDYQSLNLPVMVTIGDRDKMITLEETLAVYKALPDARMCMLPETQHPIEQANIQHLLFCIRQFI